MKKPKKKKDEQAKKHPWRENIEVLVGAVVVALLFKYFILEISKIPSGSMQPTLMGSPSTGVFDRVLVDKLSFRFRDPHRFEVVVFKHPLERSRVMVKRLVGMPGEELKIENGDLWVRPLPAATPGDDAQPWTVLRRPDAVQEAHWRTVDPADPKRSSWGPATGDGWLVTGRSARTSTPGSIRFRRTIKDTYTDGYPDSLRDAILARYTSRDRESRPSPRNVGDLRVRGRVKAEATARLFSMKLTEGDRTYEFRLPGPAAEPDARAEVRIRNARASSDERERVVTAEDAFRLKGKHRFSAENLDDRLRLKVDGDVILEVEVDPAEQQSSRIMLAFEGGGGELDGLQVERDTFYLPGKARDVIAIPEGQYVMMGDNTQDSADSRLWEMQSYRLKETGEELAGNYRRSENPLRGTGPSRDLLRIKDTYGEVRWFPTSSLVQNQMFSHDQPHGIYGPITHEPLVPRELIQGRGLAVFWPIKPHRGLYRLGWLR